MRRALTMTTLVSAAALGLASCDSEDVENTAVDDIDEIVDEDINDEAYPVGDDLTEGQQADYDAMDRQAVSDEYDRNMADMQASRNADRSGTTSSTSSDQSMNSATGSDTNESSSTEDRMGGGSDMSGSESTMSGSSSSIPRRSQMTFSYLDRNNDGQLSVAEYAIWALPTNPTPPEPNDALGPHLTQDEINTAGQTFFSFDDDGDTYLSQEEFAAARASARTAS